MNLAQILYDAYPHSDLLPIDPQSDLNDLKTLHRKVAATNIGDGLFTFLVIELDEGGGNIDDAIRLLQRAHNDVEVVLQAVIVAKQSQRFWKCPNVARPYPSVTMIWLLSVHRFVVIVMTKWNCSKPIS